MIYRGYKSNLGSDPEDPVPQRSPTAELHRHYLGPHPIIRHYLQRMNWRGILRGCLGAGLRQGLDHAEVLAVLVHNVLVSRGPMYRIREWAERIEPEALGLTGPQVRRLNDDRLVRSLEALAGERGRSVFFRLALRAIKDFELQVPRIHFDTTTVTFFGQYESSRSEPRITHGVNKDHRPDLKQLLFGLNVTSDGAVPLLHHIFSGNRTDDSVHVRNLDLLRTLLGTEDFIYVADSKLCTRENLEHVAAYGGLFVTVLPRTRKEDQLFRQQVRTGSVRPRWRTILRIPSSRRADDPADVYASTRAGPQETSEGYRIIWIRSSQKAELDRRARLERIRRAELELKDLAHKVGSRQLRSRRAVLQRVEKELRRHKATGWLDVRVATITELEQRHLRRGRPRPGDPVRTIRRRRLQLDIQRNRRAIHQESRTDGIFPLVTNIQDRAKREILEIYKYQPYVEKRFALTKSEYGVTPVFLKKPVRVAGLLHVYFAAIMLSALLERQVRVEMKARRIPKIPILPEGRWTATPTTPRILENFTEVAWHEYREGERIVSFPVKLTRTQELILELSDVPKTLYR
ncbi:MAG: IS1634 family transposase [Candidatus Eisenbacteria bacterium]|nr:IS1634 family transposase [Candidatus Eisenbacteria bacterium]